MASGSGDVSSGQDAELDELLDSALDDFDNTVPPKSTGASASGHSNAAKFNLGTANFFETLFEGEMAAQAQDWQKAMTEAGPMKSPELLQHFQKLSEAAGKVGTDTASQQEFTSCLKDTLRGLAKNTDSLQTSGLAGDDLVKALEDLGLEDAGDGGGDDSNILPIMQSIMKGRHFEREKQESEKESTFENIMDLMQKLQELGQPPKELAGDAPPGFNFNPESLNLPGGPEVGAAEQCSIM
uniref:Peroxisomal biogenesis factor 19 n=2 Tax=Tetraodon nigroviridis TaxID=99883 RepID=H3C0N9_TETNG